MRLNGLRQVGVMSGRKVVAVDTGTTGRAELAETTWWKRQEKRPASHALTFCAGRVWHNTDIVAKFPELARPRSPECKGRDELLSPFVSINLSVCLRGSFIW